MGALAGRRARQYHRPARTLAARSSETTETTAMARICALDTSPDPVTRDLTRALQSGHLHFLIGSGASHPAIPLAGDIEATIDTHLRVGNNAEADALLYQLLSSVQSPTNRLVAGTPTADESATLECYSTLLRTIERILLERRSTVIGKQALLFTTNYDLFLDVAALRCESAVVNNGFDKALTIDGAAVYSSRRFLTTTYDTGNFYDYRVERPSINLVKLHGCLTWQRTGEHIFRRPAHCDIPAPDADDAVKRAFVDRQSIVLPQASKFNTTILDRTYYELLRFFANTLDKENSLLIAFGFSFRDEHILHVIRRALTNPTLRILAVAYDHTSRDDLSTRFAAHNNVVIVSTDDGTPIDFRRFNELLTKSGPSGSPAS